MIGIEKGDIMMKINEVNTMTPRQNDLVVKNKSYFSISSIFRYDFSVTNLDFAHWPYLAP